MVQWSEEWMEQLIAEAEKNVPVPVPANMKDSVLQYVERKHQITNVRRNVYYHMKLCAAACMALVILAGTAVGLQRREETQQKAYDLAGEIGRQMDTFVSVINEKMNAIVRMDSPDDQGGR